MSGFISAAVAVAGAVVAGATIYSADQSRKASHQAADRQLEQARLAEAQKREQFKRANQKEVDVGGLLQQNAQGGMASTMLTGAGGIDPTQLQLGGKNNLLGG